MAHDVPVRRVVGVGLGIAAVVAAIAAFVLIGLRALQRPPGGEAPLAPGAAAVEGPAVLTAPQQAMADYRAEQQRKLEAIGWVDRAHGIARIPVADAMALLAASAPEAGR